MTRVAARSGGLVRGGATQPSEACWDAGPAWGVLS